MYRRIPARECPPNRILDGFCHPDKEALSNGPGPVVHEQDALPTERRWDGTPRVVVHPVLQAECMVSRLHVVQFKAGSYMVFPLWLMVLSYRILTPKQVIAQASKVIFTAPFALSNRREASATGADPALAGALPGVTLGQGVRDNAGPAYVPALVAAL